MPTEFYRTQGRGGGRDTLAILSVIEARQAGKSAVVLVPTEHAKDALCGRWPALDPSWVVTPNQAGSMGYRPPRAETEAAREEARAERTTRAAVKRRSRGLCELRIPGVCTKWGESMHHRLPEGQGGKWSVDNIIHVCGHGTRGCHGWVEHNRETDGKGGPGGYARGWLVHTGTDPRSVPWSPWDSNA